MKPIVNLSLVIVIVIVLVLVVGCATESNLDRTSQPDPMVFPRPFPTLVEAFGQNAPGELQPPQEPATPPDDKSKPPGQDVNADELKVFSIPSREEIEKQVRAEILAGKGQGDKVLTEADKIRADKEAEGRKEFFGLSLGIAPTAFVGGKKAINRAHIDTSGGSPVVRVDSQNESDVAVLLETHYFFSAYKKGSTQFGHGPFLSLKLGDGEIVDGLGFGYMGGWRSGTGSSSRSFNFGIGPFLDRNVQVLGRGFSDGNPPPAGATEVQFREQDVWRFAITFSFSWGF